MNNSPWAKLTTSMMPKISVSPDATSARIMPVTMPLTVWITDDDRQGKLGTSPQTPRYWWMTGSSTSSSDGRGVVAHHALLHEVDALAGGEGERHVLLDQQDGDAFPVQHVDDLADLRHHARHQAFGRLVQQDDLGLQHHRARDRQHLLLAARQRAAGLAAPLGQHAENSANTLSSSSLLAWPRSRRARSSPVRRFSMTVSSRKMRRSSGT